MDNESADHPTCVALRTTSLCSVVKMGLVVYLFIYRTLSGWVGDEGGVLLAPL